MNKLILFTCCFFYGSIMYSQQPSFYEPFNSDTETGVKGKAKIFDGFFTQKNIDAKAISIANSFTVEAWVAVQEYASRTAAIVDKESDFKSGFLFGIDHAGRLSGSISVNGEWITCLSNEPLPLLKWAHVAMVVENNKAISLYIDGKMAGEKALTAAATFCDTCSLSIGKTQTKTTAANTERATSSFIKIHNYFDGLIDELYIYPNALSANDLANKYTATIPTNKQPLQFRQMNAGSNEPSTFGAIYTRLKYSPGWDALWRGSDYPDIVVRFDNSPIKYVFWRGTGYIPAIVNEKNMWMTDQSLEHWGTGECYEAMGDKQARYSNVRIIENTPARVVVHWRYALAGIKHQLFPEDENGWSDWADEYWAIYPDGIAARKQVLWSKRYETDKGSMQWQETIFFCQPGTRPQDNVDMKAISFMDMAGNKESYSWEDGPPKLKMFTSPKYQPIELVNFKATYKPFSIFDEKRVCQPFSFGNMKEYTTFPNWNHWPVQQVMSDGRNAIAPDKPSHASLTGSNGKMQIVEKKADGVYWASSLRGMTDQSIETLMPLAKSWNNAPAISSSSATFAYDKYQRAYIVSGAKEEFDFTVNATENTPVCNLSLVLENYKKDIKSIKLNGKKLKKGKDYNVGQVDGLENAHTVLFIKVKSNTPLAMKINY